MSKYDKKLKKALAQYENGNYEEALDICEKVLDKDYNNEEALTLESRALEKLNRISDAIVSWKINAEYNNNEEARTKLDKFNNLDEKKLAMSTIFSETMKDEIKARLQEEAQKEYAKQLEKRDSEIKPLPKDTEKEKENKKVEQAPVIKINKEKPREDVKIDDIKPLDHKVKETSKTESNRLDNVTKVDFHKKDEIKKSKDKPKDDNEPKVISTPNFKNEKSNAKKSNKKKPVKYIAVAVSGAIVLLLAYGVTKNIKTTDASKNQITASEEANNNANKTENSTDNKTNEDSKKETETKTITADELNKAISNNDINSLYTLLTSTPKDKVPQDALDAYNKAENLMKTDGVKDLYLKGSDLFKEKKYEDALKDFEKAYAFSSDSYLRPHLIYFMGTSYENLDKNTEAIKYFQEYLKDYKAKPDAEDFMYTPQCLYNLAILYNKEGNSAESKKYAQEIENDYPNTMFYNDVTKKIIYGK
ncbi:MAG: tetratricopeptide repeat protein [Clostridium perfringens]|uniref:tetratricopeptide repeat protein n=1 Tax=Clostridium perfringens TaxID=1502 RepID=UPI00115B174C|nr:tetratricopeptide repeat protein [Clostridium perfringens]EHK2362382.1 tetratricopeptide repeat protein [Clostridium perfringens]MDK0561222.1 tetratricopeptide repeat protein [Clostridium perfringens]MDM0911155.1 tetratricopeptide repeat protein [Clostridium perfringens]MDM0942042.1 tetratricopeptide repeat protein [Clostridium perfringens]MDM0965453.1 tetratricopeptide repeat protein [Clostridium perfringens]